MRTATLTITRSSDYRIDLAKTPYFVDLRIGGRQIARHESVDGCVEYVAKARESASKAGVALTVSVDVLADDPIAGVKL